MDERGQATAEVRELVRTLSQGGVTVVIVGDQRHVCGFITLADRVRANARIAVGQLRALGVEHMTLLTGGNAPTARAIAEAAGVNDFRAEMLPADKVNAVSELVSRFGTVAMVGDGVNDAPAMARASLGIAMGAAGSDTALETADIGLMSDDLTRIPWLVSHSRRALRVIRANIALSLSIKAVFVALTFMGFESLWAAIAADTGACLLVNCNGLRLLDPGRSSLIAARASPSES